MVLLGCRQVGEGRASLFSCPKHMGSHTFWLRKNRLSDSMISIYDLDLYISSSNFFVRHDSTNSCLILTLALLNKLRCHAHF